MSEILTRVSFGSYEQRYVDDERCVFSCGSSSDDYYDCVLYNQWKIRRQRSEHFISLKLNEIFL